MVTIPLDKINYNKVSKYANFLIFKEFYPKTKNVSYYLKFKMLSPSRVICVTKLYESLFRCRVTVTLYCGLAKFTFNSSRMHECTFSIISSCVNLPRECISSGLTFIYKDVLQGHLLFCCLFLYFHTIFGNFLTTDYLFCDLLFGYYNNLH